jgi:glycosyltransferase involved in cell wall biosynthesis
MKLLIVSQYFWPENFRINDLVADMVGRGHEVTVLTGLPNYPAGYFSPGYSLRGPYREQYKGVDVIRCPLIPRGSGSGLRLALNYLSFAVVATVRALLVCRKGYDVIFVHEPSPITVGLPAVALTLATRVPVMLWVLDLWPESVSATQAIRSSRVLRWIERMVRFIYRHCDRILVQSHAFVPHVEQQQVPSEKILYFPSWAEALYEVSDGRLPVPENVYLPEGFRVMFAGNVGAAQDFETILTAAERVKSRADIHWIIVGDGRMLSWAQAEVERRQLIGTVHFLGRHPLETMPAFFAQADALLVTLRREPIFALTIPGKVQSYLASGRPIIAALDGEGARIIQEAGAGVICPAESPGALADAVVRLAETPKETRDLMGRRGMEYYGTHFDRTMLFGQLEKWMQELIERQGKTRASAAPESALSSERGRLS